MWKIIGVWCKIAVLCSVSYICGYQLYIFFPNMLSDYKTIPVFVFGSFYGSLATGMLRGHLK